ncbi:MAG TPA: tetratricopeptide repeat protein [Armatimonadota bacterium]|nr:tetratricopeptide repeat protein [Armatimonadota bacterium]
MNKETWRSYFEMGVFETGEFNFEEAKTHLEKALSIVEKEGGCDHCLGMVLWQLAIATEMGGNLEEAIALNKRLLETQETRWDSHISDYPATLLSLGELLQEVGKPATADVYLQKALEVYRQEAVRILEKQAKVLMLIAQGYAHQERYKEAEEAANKAVLAYERVDGPDAYALAEVLKTLAGVYRRIGNIDKAEDLEARSASIKDKFKGDYPSQE